MPPARKSKPRTPELGALGNAIKQLRTQASLSQEQLAERASTDLTQIGGLERGTRNPSYSTLVRVAKALKTRVGDIANLADQIADQAESSPPDPAPPDPAPPESSPSGNSIMTKAHPRKSSAKNPLAESSD